MIGIYAIINKLNNDMYIGSAKNIHKRIYNHFIKLKHRNHPNGFLQRAKNKYGNVFYAVVICQAKSRDLWECEQYWVDYYQPEYNFNDEVASPWSGSNLTRQIKDKLSESHKGKSTWMLGKHHTKKSKIKISKSSKGRKHTEATKKKIAKASHDRWRNLGYKKRIGRLISKVASKRYLNLKYRKKLSEAQKLMWKNPKYRINRQKTQNKANKKRSASMKVAWRNPIIRERIVKSLRRKRV